MKNLKTNIPVATLALFALVGCGSSGSADEAASTPPATPKASPGNPNGTAPSATQGTLAAPPPMRTGG